MERLCSTRHPEGDWQRDEGSISLQQEHPEMVYELNFQHRLKVKYMYSMGYWDIFGIEGERYIYFMGYFGVQFH